MPQRRPPGPKDESKIVGPAPPPASHASKSARPPGLYEELITHRLEAALEEIRGEGWHREITNLDPAEASGVLARFMHDLGSAAANIHLTRGDHRRYLPPTTPRQ